MNDAQALPIVPIVRNAILEILDGRLVGLYVYGSLVSGDFEPDVSDVDLIAVLDDEPDRSLARRLSAMHQGIVRAAPEWDDRIEVDYVSSSGLADCRTAPTTIARVSPGEPLHLIRAGRDFLLDWYPARQDGVALVGPPIATLIPSIPESDYLEEVRSYLASFRTRLDEDASAGSQAYAILTMCRGVYALTDGVRLSKRAAALRARDEFPRWGRLIDLALAWRDRRWEADQPDASSSEPETRAFIQEMADLIGLR